MRIVSKKHWFSYTGEIIVIVLLPLPIFIALYNSNVATEIHWIIFKYGLLIIALWITYKMIKSFILRMMKSWTFENNSLNIKSGLLPWYKVDFHIKSNQIYEAYYGKSFLGTILNYGSIKVRRTDGVTTTFSELSMTNAKEMTQALNNARDLQNEKKLDFSEPPLMKSIPDELRKLADLNRDGIISEEEFKILKNKIIGSS